MAPPAKNILITGNPGVGKTTMVRKLADMLGELGPAGFYTAEIRDHGKRLGFELIDLAGDHLLLSHIGLKSPFRVGKYGVDVGALEKYLDTRRFTESSSRLIIIDEIGKMECCSAGFIREVATLLDSDKRVLATIAKKGGGPIEAVKRRPDVRMFEVTLRNRDSLGADIAGLFKERH